MSLFGRRQRGTSQRTRSYADAMGGEWAEDGAGAAMETLLPGWGVFLAGPAAQVTRNVRQEWQRARSRAIKAAERTSGLSREDLAERIAADPMLIPLVTRVLYAAGMTGHDRILDALGAALGDALAHPDRVDEAELVIIGLERIRPTHIAVLETLNRPPLKREGDADTWDADTLETALGGSRSSWYSAAMVLVNAGFAESHNGFGGGTQFSVTPLGETLLQVLAAHGGGKDGPPRE